ncbi:hypothetical protein VTK73DRAFT_7373 [Phialemonium thermophilum]|uniref:Uncharacterized protein n=1 Tax=Phialemonium thermophilum TaxID=223376 RepID=A0ABR3WEX5_9PEZI
MRISFAIVPAVVGIAVANDFVPMNPPVRPLSAPMEITHNATYASLLRLELRSDTCSAGEKECDDGCIPLLKTCCPGTGHYCDQTETCDGDGCCPLLKTCSGVVGGCSADQEPCADGCMEKGGDCCSDGHYCSAGYKCTGDNKCKSSGGGKSYEVPLGAVLTAFVLLIPALS